MYFSFLGEEKKKGRGRERMDRGSIEKGGITISLIHELSRGIFGGCPGRQIKRNDWWQTGVIRDRSIKFVPCT